LKRGIDIFVAEISWFERRQDGRQGFQQLAILGCVVGRRVEVLLEPRVKNPLIGDGPALAVESEKFAGGV
jgi:hypothetical protein